MIELIIWTTYGEVKTIYVTEDMLDYEMQVLDHDPAVKEYSVHSL